MVAALQTEIAVGKDYMNSLPLPEIKTHILKGKVGKEK